VCRDDADGTALDDQRDVQAGGDACFGHDCSIDLGIGGQEVRSLGPAAREHASDLRALHSQALVEQRDRVLSHRRRDPERALALEQRDQHEPCADELTKTGGDDREQRVELDLARQGVADLVQGFELAEPAGRRLVQSCVLNRDRGLRGEETCELFVLLRELAASFLLGEVEVAVNPSAQQHRHSQERVHWGVIGREPDRMRVVPDVGEPERPGVVDQRAQDAAADRLVADRLALGWAQTRREESLELLPRRVDDAERRVPCVGELRRRVDDSLQQRFERQLRAQ
jgi:hypothetical protein